VPLDDERRRRWIGIQDIRELFRSVETEFKIMISPGDCGGIMTQG
jgi:hypothetical protein